MRQMGIWFALLLLLPSLSCGDAEAAQFNAELDFSFADTNGNPVPDLCLAGVPIFATVSVCDNQDSRDSSVRNAASDDDPKPGYIRISNHYSGTDTSMVYDILNIPRDYQLVLPSDGQIQVSPRANLLTSYHVTLWKTEVARGANGQCEVVELYPGYPGYRGVLPGLIGKGDTACLADLERIDPSFSKNVQDAANRQVARELGIAGEMQDWTWETWMVIGAERGYGYICYTCLWLSDQPLQPTGPPLPSLDYDPRLLLMYPWSNTFLLNFGLAHDLPQYQLDRITDGELRILASLMYQGYPTATELQSAAEYALGSYFGVPGYEPGFRDYAYAERQIICRGGHVPIPRSVNPGDRTALTYFGLVVAAESVLTAQVELVRDTRLNMLDSQFTDWRAQTLINPNTPSFAEYLAGVRGIRC